MVYEAGKKSVVPPISIGAEIGDIGKRARGVQGRTVQRVNDVPADVPKERRGAQNHVVAGTVATDRVAKVPPRRCRVAIRELLGARESARAIRLRVLRVVVVGEA